jgi:hypothetical protein
MRKRRLVYQGEPSACGRDGVRVLRPLLIETTAAALADLTAAAILRDNRAGAAASSPALTLSH